MPQGKPVTATQAIEKLQSGAGKDNKLDFKIEVSPGQYSSPYLVHIRTENKTVYLPSDSSQTEDENNSGLSDGGTAAISVLLLILGIALGVVGTLLALYILHRVRSKSTGKTSAVSYKKQIDDVDVNTETVVD